MNHLLAFLSLSCFSLSYANPSEIGVIRASDIDGFYLPPKLLSWTQVQDIIGDIRRENSLSDGNKDMKTRFML